MTTEPSRQPSHLGEPRTCVLCTTVLVETSRARYCTRACQQRAYRLRHHQPSQLDLAAVEADLRRRRQRTTHLVYECGTCETRYLGQRRCTECNLFCRALGLGGPCPDCDELILVAELLGEEG